MRKVLIAFVFIALLGVVLQVRAATCSATGFYRDGNNMTAALINPQKVVTGEVDATGCNVGVYFDAYHAGRVDSADVYGANYFGVLVNGDNGPVRVDVQDSFVHHIGEVPHNGAQHGVAIYYRGFAYSVKGTIQNNWIWDYQKGGIVANGDFADVTITNNYVTGDGHVNFIAQNGIQVGYGASANVSANTVIGNSYIGYPGDGSSSGGILVVGGPGYGTCPPTYADCPYTTNLQIVNNTVMNNDVGIYLSNLGPPPDNNPPSSRTNILVANNLAYDDLCYNVSENGPGYQAGISDVGNGDKILGNTVFGPGYTPPCGLLIDISDATNPIVHSKSQHLARPHQER
jgi:hypothetical protein